MNAAVSSAREGIVSTSKARIAHRMNRAALDRAVFRWFEALEGRQMFAFVATDQADYHYGDTALIAGGDFAPNETVQLQVTHVAGTDGSNADPQNQAWTVQADESGTFTASWLVNDPDALHATYNLTATGLTSGESAAATFTDSISAPVTIATAGNTTGSTTLQSSTFSQAVAIGNTIIVTLAMDPNSGGVTLADSKGNTYTKDADVTNGSGTSGVRTLVFSARVTVALTTSDRVTATFGTSTAAKAISVHSVSGLVSVATDKTSTAIGNSSSPSSGNTATTSQPDELLIGAVGVEDKSNTMTAGASFTNLTQANTGSGGGGSSNMIINSEYRIASATGAFAASGTLTAAAQWAAAIVTYKIDVPSVTSIVRTSSTPTGALSVSWTVTFNKSVTGVDSADFALATTGSVSGASITSVVPLGGNSWTVTANTGSGDGTLGLNLVDNDTIKDANLNPLGGTGIGNGNLTGEIYTIDKANPTVASIVLANPSPTNAASVSWTVTFSESVSAVDATDFALVASGGVSGAGISGVTGGGTTWTVTANTGSGEGTLGLNLVDNDSIIDAGNNPLGGAGAGNGNFTGPIYTIDRTSPTVTINQNNADPTKVSPIHFTVIFSESVTGFTASDVQLGGTANPTTVNITGSGTTYDVAVSGMSGSGTVTATVIAGAAQDSAGNLNLASTSTDNTVTYDITAPAAPVFTGIVNDTGSSSTDKVTSDPSLMLLGTAEANSTVTITRVGLGVIGTTVADGSGNFSFDYTGTTLAAGTYSFTATATDAAGNVSAVSLTLGVTIDTAAPAAPAITGIATDSGNGADRITNDPTLVLSGTAEANSTVTITRADLGVIGTTTANGLGNWSFDYTGTSLAEGSYTFTATATDLAGNTSASSANFNVTIDTSTPGAPVITGIVNDTGSNTSDGVTSDPTLVLNGTAEAGSTVTLSRSGVGVIGTAVANGSGNWSFDYTGTTLVAGTYSFTATSTDSAGNVSAASGAFSVTVDTSAPAAPVITTIVTDSGSSPSDRVTSDQSLVISGTAEANSTVTLSRSGVGVIGTATANGSGNWSFDYTGVTLAEGSYTFTATAMDLAGNTSPISANFNVTVDITPPAAPVISSFATDSGTLGDSITNDNTIQLNGTAEANANVQVFDGLTLLGTVTASGVGAWSFTTAALADGLHTFTAKAQDAAGNTSAASSTMAITIDTAPPAAPAMPDLADTSDTGGSQTDNITFVTTPLFTGTAAANSTVSVFDGATLLGTTTADGSGNWSFLTPDVKALSSNSGGVVHTITAKATDAAGNVSAASPALTITVQDQFKIGGVAVTNQAPKPVNPGGIASYDLTLTRGDQKNSGGTLNIDLSVSWQGGVPAGVTILGPIGAHAVTLRSGQPVTTVLFRIATTGSTPVGIYPFTITAGAASGSVIGTGTLVVGFGADQGPNANNDTAATTKNTAVNINVVANDLMGPLSSPFNVTSFTSGANGIVQNLGGGVLKYTPVTNFTGTDTFTYTITDGNGLTDTALVTVFVDAGNIAPIATADSYMTPENQALVVAAPGVLANDSDPNGDTIQAKLVTGPSHGSLTLNLNGSFTYTPAASYVGDDSFIYYADDGTFNSNQVLVTITVGAVNDAPVNSVPGPQATNEDTALVFSSANGNAITVSDIDADPGNVRVSISVTNGTLTLSGVAGLTFNSGANGTGAMMVTGTMAAINAALNGMTFLPGANYNGPVTLSITTNDLGNTGTGGALSDTDTVAITVNPVNDPPVAQDQPVNTLEDMPVSITLVATDVDSASLTYSIVAGPLHGTLLQTSPGIYTYTPSANYHGFDSFTFKANDGSLDSNIATVAINVASVNDAPTADSQSVDTNQNTPVTVTLTGSDIDGEPLVYRITALPAHGSLFDGAGTSGHLITAADLAGGYYTLAGAAATYLPAADYFGTDGFVFKTNDASADSAPANVSITVHDITPPVITLSGSVGNETDGDTQAFTWSVTDPSGLGSVSVTITQNGATVFTSASASGTANFDALGLGNFEIVVTATDTVGNMTTASRAVSVSDDDSAGPTISLSGSEGTENDGQPQSFGWNISDLSNLTGLNITITRDGEEVYSTSNLANATGNFNFDSLGLGTYQITISAEDADADRAGDTATSIATRTVTVGDDDMAGPVITITGSEGTENDGQGQVFNWSVVDAGSGIGSVSVSVTRDGVEVFTSTDASGSFDFNSLGLGDYQISVTATDADADRTGDAMTSSASRSVSVNDDDTAAPVITITGSENAENDGQDQVFNWSVVDAGSGIGSVLVSVTRDGVEVFTSTNASGTFDFNSLGLGEYQITVVATDADADRASDSMTASASRSVSVSDDDTTGPAISITGSSGLENDGQPQAFNWNISDADSGLSSLEITITRDDGTGPVVVYHSTNLANAIGGFNFDSLGLGVYNITISATDADNDRASDSILASATQSVTVSDDDTAAPIITLGGSTGSETDGDDNAFTWSVVDGGSGIGLVSVSVTRDGVEVFTSTDASGSFDFNSLGLGDYQITVTATDADADRLDDAMTATSSRIVTVSDDDAAAPIVTLGGSTGDETDGDDNAFTWTVSDAGSGLGSVLVSILKDGVEIYTSTDASGSYDLNALGLGMYTINVTATDADGDRLGDAMMATASRSVNVTDDDVAGPAITLSGSEGDENDGQNQSFTWSVEDTGSGLGSVLVTITQDGVTIHTSNLASGSFDFNSYGLGEFEISVIATDADGDRLNDAITTNASRTVVVTDDDTAVPVITLGGSDGSQDDGQDQVFTWDVTDAGSNLGSVLVTITRDGATIHTSNLLSGSFDFNSYGLGEYQISVVATDADADRLNDAATSTASQTVTVTDDDTAAPVITITGSEGSENDGQNQAFNWTVTDAGSGVGSVLVSVTRDGIEVFTSTDASGTFNFNSLGLGDYQITVTATDADSDRASDAMTASASRSVTVGDDDMAGPVISITGSEGSENDGLNQVFNWNVSDAGSGVGSVLVTITKNGATIHTSTDLSGSFDFNSLGLGDYQISITATDADADRADDAMTSTASQSVTVTDDDTAAPMIDLTGSSGTQNDGQNQVFGWNVTDAGSGLGSVLVSILKDGVEIYSTTDATGTFDFNALGLGIYTINVTATDADADRTSDSLTSTATQTVTVGDDDIAAPVITITGSEGSENDGQNQVFNWNVVDGGSGLGSVSVSVTKNGVEIFTSTDASGTFDFNSLGLGDYQITVSATDADGDWTGDSMSSSDSRLASVSDDDITPPLITLGGSSSDETDGADNHYTWSVSDTDSGLSNVTVSILRDGVEVFNSTNASGGFDFNSLGLGTYTINVSATDSDADRADDSLTATATRTITVTDDDSEAPVIVITGSTGTETDGDDQSFSWSVTDAGSGVGSVMVVITQDGDIVYTSTDANGTFNFNSLGLGTFEIHVAASDADGDRIGDASNTASSRMVVVGDDDIVPPVITIGGSNGSETDAADNHFTWAVTDAGSGIGNVDVSVTRDGVEVFTSHDASGSFDFNSLGLGTYAITVNATDADSDRASDALSSSDSASVTVNDDDTAAPIISITGSDGSENDGQNQVFNWTVTDGGSGVANVLVSVTRDGAEVFTSTDLSGTFDFNSLGLGDYQITVTATDADADRTDDALTATSSRSVSVSDDDVAAPVITITGSEGSENDGEDQVFNWSVVDAGSGVANVSVSVTRDGVEVFTSTDASGTFNFNSLGLGDYQITVTATDADGDRLGDAMTATASRSVSVGDDDTAAPVITIGGSEGSETDGDDQAFNWTVTDGGSGIGSVLVTILKNGVEIFSSTDATGTYNFNTLGLGDYQINITATDADGDRLGDALTATSSRSVSVGDDDMAAPVIDLGGSTGAENDGDNNHFTWNVTDAGSGLGSVLVSILKGGVEIYSTTDATGSYDLNALGLGTYTINVTATDADGDRSDDALTATASRSVTVSDDDTDAPVLTLGGSETAETDGADNHFTWSASDLFSGLSNVSVSITRDGVEVFNSANSVGSFDFNSLGLGTYVMTVTATDADADWTGDSLTSVATRTVVVSDDDTTAPQIVLTGSTGNETDGDDNQFGWSVSDAGSGLGSVLVSILKDGVEIYTSTNASGSYDLNALGNGTYTINVTATDADGDRLNDALTATASRSVTIGDDDTAAPVIVIGGSNGAENDGQDNHFTWSVTDAGSGIGSVLVTVTRDGSTIATFTTASGSFDFNSYGLGTYQISVTATDADNDVVGDSLTSSDSHSVTVSDDDELAPAINLSGSTGTETDAQDQKFTWSVSDVGSGLGSVSVIVTRDGVEIMNTTTAGGTFDFNSLGLGTYTITVIATDADADRTGDSLTSTATRTVVVEDDDTTQPSIVLSGSNGNETDAANQHFGWNASDLFSGLSNVTVSVTRNGVEVYNSTNASGDFDFNSLGLGTYTITVTATDADADRADDSLTATATQTVIVGDDDVDAPIITLGGSNGSETDNLNQNFTWLVTDAGSGLGSVAVSVTRDGVEIFTSTAASGTFDFNSYGPGEYAINVTATDADNDRVDDALTATASRNVIVSDDDTTPPLITIGGSNGSETDGDNNHFTWAVTDAGSGVGSVSVTVTRDGASVFTSTDTSGSFDFNSLGLGVYEIHVTATDADADYATDSLSSSDSASVTVTDDDTDLPAILTGGSIGTQNDGQTQGFNWNISDLTSGLANVTITITHDGDVIYSTSNLADAISSFNFDSYGLGTYTLSISATDADADRTGDSLTATATRTVTVTDDDVTPPVINLSGSNGAETDGDINHFGWSISDGGSGLSAIEITITRDNGDGPEVIFHTTDLSALSGDFDFNSYGLGTYAINVTATDGDADAANDSLTSLASRTVVVTDDDSTPPVVTLQGSHGTELDSENQTFSWDISDTGSGLSFSSVVIRRNGVTIFTSSDASGTFDFNSYGLGTFEIFASAGDNDIDRVGDGEVASGLRVDVVNDDDTDAPIISLGGSEGSESDGDNNHFTWNTSDLSGLENVLVTVTHNGVQVFSSNNASDSFDFNSLGLGTYVMTVTATDADADWVGDALTATASRTVTVTDDDVTPPAIFISGSNGAENDGQNQSFTWTVTDAGSGIGSVSVTVTRDGATVFTSTDVSGTFDFNSLGLGTYVITVNATDADTDHAGDTLSNSASQTAIVSDDDTTPPVIFLTGSSGSQTDGDNQFFTWDASDAGSGLGSVLVTITRNGSTVFTSTDASGAFDFNSLGLGTYNITVTATDADSDRLGDSLTWSDSRTVSVSDDDTTPPTILLGGSNGLETDGADNHFTWSASDLFSGLSNATVSITRNGVEVYNSSNASGSFDFNSLGLGTYTITVTATDADADRDNDSLTTAATRTVVVSDDDVTPPVITLGGSSGTQNDGQNQLFTWSVSDAGSGIGSVSVSVTRNGVEIFTSTSVSGSFDFNSYGPGSYAMTVNATDADNDRASDSLTTMDTRLVTVSDDDTAGPAIVLSGSTGDENDGQNQTFGWNVSDLSGLSNLQVTITRDGVTVYSTSSLANAIGSFDFNSLGLGTYVINVSATDADADYVGDSMTTFGSRTVNVTDDDVVGPAIALGGSQGTESHGLTQFFTWSASDAQSGLTNVTVTITRDGSTIYTGSAASGSFNFDSLGLGFYEITVSATDGDADRAGDSITEVSSHSVIVTNANPKPVTGDEQTSNEGSAVTFDASQTGDVDGDSLTFEWDFGDGTFGSGVAPTHTYADNGDYVATVTARDAFGGVGTTTVVTHVMNVNPTPNMSGPGSASEGQMVNLSMTFTDPGSDTHTFLWHITSSNGQVVADGHGNNFNFIPTNNGSYTVTLTVTDDDGGAGSTSKTIFVSNVAPTANNSGSTSKQYSDSIIPVTVNAFDAGSGDNLVASIVGGLPVSSGLSLNWNSALRTGTITGKANLAPGTYNVDVLISDGDGGSVHTFVPIVISREDALINYSGPAFLLTAAPGTSTATITLKATVEDITNQFPLADADAGDIRNATVTFINRDTGAIIAANVPVSLVNVGDQKVGVATYNWTVDIGTADAASYTIGMVVNNYYTRDNALDNAVVTVAKPIDGAISGGGYIVNKSSGGFLAGDLGLRTNFGFNVKYNKSGTSTQGNVNIIVRSYNLPNGTRDSRLHVYQIKSTAITLLQIFKDTSGILHATFTAKANVQDITDPRNVISIAGGLSLEMTVTDMGEPGAMKPGGADTIGFTLKNGTSLWYSSDWDGSKTVEDILGGGNIQIRDNTAGKK